MSRRLTIAIAGFAVLSACTTTVAVGPVRSPVRSAALCSVPPGHLPPPGQCRIWYREAPPGQQPAPGDCFELQARVPRGACLVYGE